MSLAPRILFFLFLLFAARLFIDHLSVSRSSREIFFILATLVFTLPKLFYYMPSHFQNCP